MPAMGSSMSRRQPRSTRSRNTLRGVQPLRTTTIGGCVSRTDASPTRCVSERPPMSEQSIGDGPAVRRTDVLRASPPMFESRVLDAFSRVHPSVPILIFTPVIVALAAWQLSFVGALETLGLFAGGYALWTLFEYWLHRLVFHFEPDHGLGARMHWIIHGIHHEHPNDPLRLVMPPAVSIPLGRARVWRAVSSARQKLCPRGRSRLLRGLSGL